MFDPSSQPVLELRGVSKRFGAVQALTNVDLDVHASEVVALVGDNGAGKSTLVKTISGVNQADEGEIVWQGDAVSIKGPHDAQKLGIATVYQDRSGAHQPDPASGRHRGQTQNRGLGGCRPVRDAGHCARPEGGGAGNLS